MSPGPILLFDGVCNLCSGTVRFLLKKDGKGIFRFASLQSPAARDILIHFASGVEFPDSMILLDEGALYTESTAALRTARLLGGAWSWLYYLFVWIPRPVRDWVYRRVAANRYRWFGKRDQCLVPTPEFQKRFLG